MTHEQEFVLGVLGGSVWLISVVSAGILVVLSSIRKDLTRIADKLTAREDHNAE
jgi:hypothetical protein